MTVCCLFSSLVEGEVGGIAKACWRKGEREGLLRAEVRRNIKRSCKRAEEDGSLRKAMTSQGKGKC